MKKFIDMPMDELVDYWLGHLCIAIGKGEARAAVSLMI